MSRDQDLAAELADAVRLALRAAADPQRAPGQQAYMKSAMPFLGVSVPVARRVAIDAARDAGASAPGSDADVLRSAALLLWDAAAYREERYAAMALLRVGGASADHGVVSVIEHMVRTGRWWDYTDELAHPLSALHDRDPLPTAALARQWSTDVDMWMRRIAIISQLGRRDRVDRQVLADVIVPNLADPEFFIRKAIGWALRDTARVDPSWVRTFAAAHPLSALSRREALKHL